jgi:N-acetyl-gamma-glutamyl-phosphate reductase
MVNKVSVGIYGGSGYMGGEVLRILLEHPLVEVAWVTSRYETSIPKVHQNFLSTKLNFIKPEDVTPCNLIFIALPTGNATVLTTKWLSKGTKVIDLGSDFRLKDRTLWEKVYQKTHQAWELVENATYGIVELHREKIKQAKLIANPGCFSSAAILGLAPLIENQLVELNRIIVDGLSGTSGAGAELDRAIHHPEITNNALVYNGVKHRHTHEMEQELGNIAGKKVQIGFTPAYIPISRGIVAICHGFATRKTSREELLEIFKARYANEKFVQVLDEPYQKEVSWQNAPYPWVAAVSGTNFCHIGIDYDEERERILIVSVLDSVGKGGSHVGVQNMNLMCGFPEDLGISRLGYHPY